MKIDCHQHFWIFDPVKHAWIDDSMTVLQRDFTPDHLQPLLNQHDIDGSIMVQVDQSEQETRSMLALADATPWIKAVVGWVDLKAPDIDKRLQHYTENKKLKGFRHIVQAEPDDDFLLQADFQRGIACLTKYNYIYEILVYPKQLPAAIKLVESHPQQKFVLDHIAKPLIKAGAIEPWATHIKTLAEFDNVTCKVSGIVTEADHKHWTRADIFPYLDIVFTAFGTDRLIFGSDWPVCLLAGSYHQVIDLFNSYSEQFSKTEKQKLYGENAVSVYGI